MTSAWTNLAQRLPEARSPAPPWDPQARARRAHLQSLRLTSAQIPCKACGGTSTRGRRHIHPEVLRTCNQLINGKDLQTKYGIAFFQLLSADWSVGPWQSKRRQIYPEPETRLPGSAVCAVNSRTTCAGVLYSCLMPACLYLDVHWVCLDL